ncbi:unnamed protein product [Schistosoma intercalatum]|nr:unnamed protein product [Schistosoma intercalatum]
MRENVVVETCVEECPSGTYQANVINQFARAQTEQRPWIYSLGRLLPVCLRVVDFFWYIVHCYQKIPKDSSNASNTVD